MNKTKNTFITYIDWLLTQYQTFKQTHHKETTQRLVNVEKKKERYMLTIQIIGKATTLAISPEDILANDTWVECFSSKDIRTITYYGTKALHANKKKIIAQSFSPNTNQILFDIQDIKTTKITRKTASEIISDQTILHELTPEEAHKIGYIAAEDLRNQEKAQLDALRNKL